jgi:hypothetical protein
METAIKTIQYQEYCATLYSDNEIEFLYDDEVEACRPCAGLADFETIAINWIKTGDLPV